MQFTIKDSYSIPFQSASLESISEFKMKNGKWEKKSIECICDRENVVKEKIHNNNLYIIGKGVIVLSKCSDFFLSGYSIRMY